MRDSQQWRNQKQNMHAWFKDPFIQRIRGLEYTDIIEVTWGNRKHIPEDVSRRILRLLN
jgi:hypothetical protein